MTLSVAEPRAGNALTVEDWQVSNTTTTPPGRAILTETPPAPGEFPPSVERGDIAVKIVLEPGAWCKPTVWALAELLHLEQDWDTYGGSRIDPRCVVAALEMAFGTFDDDTPIPSVVPTSRGGVQFEWHTGGADLEVEFLSATRVWGLFEDRVTGICWEKDLTSNLGPLVEAISVLTRRS